VARQGFAETRQPGGLVSLSMASMRKIGRIVGALLLVHMVAGLMLPYILLDRVIDSPGFLLDIMVQPGFLESASRNALYLRAPALLFLFAGALTVGISIAVYPVLRQGSQRFALWCLALGIANLPLQAIESGMVLSMLSLSQQYAAVGTADGAMLHAVANGLGRTREWMHLIQLMTLVCWIFALFAAMWRAGRIPRVLGVAGLIACALQIAGVPLRGLLGYSVQINMGIALAPTYIALALWLIVKGFDERSTMLVPPSRPSGAVHRADARSSRE
jgi:hypothetical protein